MREYDYLPGTELILHQEKNMYHFNSDTAMLGRFMKLKHSDRVLDIGCASGALLLYAGMQKPAALYGIDLFEEVLDSCRKNLELNHMEASLACTDLQHYSPGLQFDAIVCNPPYFRTENPELKNRNPYLAAARHESYLKPEDVFRHVRRLMKSDGRFFLVHRASRMSELILTAAGFGLQAVRIRPVCDSRSEYAKSILMEFRFGQGRETVIEKPVFLD